MSVEAALNKLCSCSNDGSVKLWSVHERGAGAGSSHVQSSASKQAEAEAGADAAPPAQADPLGRVKLVHEYAGHLGGTDALCFAPHNHRLATGGKDALVKVWNIEAGEVEATFNAAHTNWVWCLRLEPAAGQLLASAGVDGNICYYDLRCRASPSGTGASAASSSSFASASAAPIGLVHRSHISSEVAGLDLHWNRQRMVTSSFDGVVRFWDMRTWKVGTRLCSARPA